MIRFGTLLAVSALALAGCKEHLPPPEPADAPVAKAPACPSVTQAKAEGGAQAVVGKAAVRKTKAKAKAKARRSASSGRSYARYERESSSGLAGGGSYARYEERQYARALPYEGRSRSSSAYSYESRESASESYHAYGEASGHAYGGGYAYAEGYHGGHGYHGTYYAAGRDERGYLTWPGKR